MPASPTPTLSPDPRTQQQIDELRRKGATDVDIQVLQDEIDALTVGASFSFIDAKGDVVVGSADNVADNLAVGSNGKVLTANSGATLGVEWATPDVTQTELDAESSARASADTTLQTNITSEASTRASADTTLQTNITTEASTRATADTTLQTNIDSEATTRAAGDTSAIAAAEAYAIQRANHTGTQLASTISNFDTQARTSRLDQMAHPTTSLDFNSQKGINAADATNPSDVPNYAQLLAAAEAAAAGLSVKGTVRVATTADVGETGSTALTLTGAGTLTIDGILLAADDRVLVKDQANGEQNGIYVYQTSGSLFGGAGTFGGSGTFGDTGAGWSLTRSTDADESAEFPNMLVIVGNEGTTNKKSSWLLTTTGTIVVGTTNLTYSQWPIPAFATPSATINAGDAAVAGTATTALRSDSQMAVATGTTANLFGGTTEGVSTNLARADHDHPWGVPSTIATGETFTVPTSRQWTYGENITLTGTGSLVINGDLVDTSGPVLGTSASSAVAGTDSRLTTYICVQEQQAVNTAAGGFTSGAYQTRVLNTEVADPGNLVTVASNRMTLAAGTYRIQASAPAVQVNQHKTRLRNVTTGTTVLVGTSEYAPPAATEVGGSRSLIAGRFTIADSQSLEIQHQCQTTKATNGFGVASNFTEVEVYTSVELWKEG